MKNRSNTNGALSRRGGVTVEMVAVLTMILLPVLLAFGELARLDRAARRLQFNAQRMVMTAAATANVDPSFHVLPVEMQASVSMRPEIRALLGGGRASATLRRCYWIATGSGHGESGD